MTGEVKPNGNGHGHHQAKLLITVLSAVGVGIAGIGWWVGNRIESEAQFNLQLIERMLDNESNQTKALNALSTNVAANTSAIEQNIEHNAKANEWLELLVDAQKEGFWRFFKYDDPKGKMP